MSKHHLHVLVLTETWHADSNCSTVKNIRSVGWNRVEEDRTIHSTTKRDSMQFVNHGVIAIMSKPGIKVSKVNLKVKLITSKHLRGCVTLNYVLSLLAIIYRSGSQPITFKFFDDLTTLLESLCIIMRSRPVTFTGDLNVHFARTEGVHPSRLPAGVADSFQSRPKRWSADPVCMLDVFITTQEPAPKDVVVIDTGMWNQMLVTWSSNHNALAPVYVKSAKEPGVTPASTNLFSGYKRRSYVNQQIWI